MLIRPELYRKDSVARILIEHINARSGQTEVNFEELISKLSDQGAWVQVAALGWVYASEQPSQVRGYLAFIDGLINISFVYDAQRWIFKFLENFGDHPLLVKRLCSLYMRTKKWEAVVDLAEQHRDNEGVVRAAIDCAMNLRQFDRATAIAEAASDQAARERIDNAHDAWMADLAHLEATYPGQTANEAVHAALEAGDFRGFNTACWKSYSARTLDAQVLRAAIQPVKGEFEYYPRVSFFRDSAVRAYPGDDEFLYARSTTLIYENRLDEAYRHLLQLSSVAREDGAVRWRLEHLRKVLFEALESDTDRAAGTSQATLLEQVSDANLAARKGLSISQFRLLNQVEKEPGRDAVVVDYLRSAQIQSIGIPRRAPKVALCISGQMRGFALTWPGIRREFVEACNPDIFVHTWDEESFTPPLFRRLSRFIGTELVRQLPLELQQTLAFSKRFPETAKKLQQPIKRAISAEEISKLVNSRYVVVEAEKNLVDANFFPKEIWHRGNANQAKMFYKIFQCDQLRIQQEHASGTPYDVVIRIRPDFNLTIEALPLYLRAVQEDASKVFVSYINPDGCGDQFAIGGSGAMTAYSSIWKHLIAKKRFDFFPGFRNRIGEELLGEHLMAAGLHPQLIPPSGAELINDLVINLVDIRPELLADVGEHASDDVKKFLGGVQRHYEKSALGRGKTADPLYASW